MNATVLDTRSAWRAPSRIGYDATAERTAARVLPMLAEERVVWLSTVRPDGMPHLVPTWFWWDGEAVVVFSKPEAVKVRNLRANPRVMVAVGDPDDDLSVGLIEAEASVVDGPASVPASFFRKYAAELEGGRLDEASFRALYTQAVRIVPTRYLAWHGRGESHHASAVEQPAPRVSVVTRLAAAVARMIGGRPLSPAAA